MTKQDSTGTEQTETFYHISNWAYTSMGDSKKPCYRFNVQDLSDAQREELANILKQHGIVSEIRTSSSGHGAGTINKGDQTLCIIGKENVAKLRKLIRESQIRESQTQLSLNWEKPDAWKECSVNYGRDSILHTYRINVQKLRPEELEQLQHELFMRGVDVIKRTASVESDGINKGDLTLRVANKESIENLEDVWLWTHQSFEKHIESTKEYNDRQEKEKERWDAGCLLADQKWTFQGGLFSIQIEDTKKQQELQDALSLKDINYDIINNDTIKINSSDTYNLVGIIRSVVPQEELQTQAASQAADTPAEDTLKLTSGEPQEKLNSKKEFVKTDSAPQEYKKQENRGKGK